MALLFGRLLEGGFYCVMIAMVFMYATNRIHIEERTMLFSFIGMFVTLIVDKHFICGGNKNDR